MVVSTSAVARRYEDVSAGTPVSVDIPAYEASDVYVYYGNASLVAVQGTDYTVALAGDFETFTVTPTASLISKINALIAADATEVNFITVRRTLDYLTDATPAGVRYTPFTSREFDRAAMRDMQLAERSARALTFPPSETEETIDGSLANVGPGQVIRRSDDGARVVGAALEVVVTGADIWFQNRDTTSAVQAASLTDGTIVWLDNFAYRVDSSATGTDSCTFDLGVDGLVPYGNVYGQHFGLTPDSATDRTTEITNMRNWLAVQSENHRSAFLTEGQYPYSVSPNWAIEGLKLRCLGTVRFVYSGTGNCVVLDGGASARPGEVYFCYDNPPLIEGGASSGDGLYLRSVHRSHVGANVRGCGGKAVHIAFSVSTNFNVRSTVNEGPFTQQPTTGLYITHRDPATERAAACVFFNPQFDGVLGAGIALDGCIFSQFVGGAVQANGGNGVDISDDSNFNTFFGTDAEVNTAQGYVVRGSFNNFVNVFSDTICTVTSTGRSNRFYGGTFDDFTNAGNGTVFSGAAFRSQGGVFTDTGTDTSQIGCFDITTASVLSGKMKNLTLPNGLTVSGGNADLPNLKVGTGARLAKLLRSSIVTGAWAVPAAVPGTVTKVVTVPGAAAGDIVAANSVTDLGNNYVLHANVTAADTVTLRITQVAGAAASPLPAGGTVNVEIRGY